MRRFARSSIDPTRAARGSSGNPIASSRTIILDVVARRSAERLTIPPNATLTAPIGDNDSSTDGIFGIDATNWRRVRPRWWSIVVNCERPSEWRTDEEKRFPLNTSWWASKTRGILHKEILCSGRNAYVRNIPIQSTKEEEEEEKDDEERRRSRIENLDERRRVVICLRLHVIKIEREKWCSTRCARSRGSNSSDKAMAPIYPGKCMLYCARSICDLFAIASASSLYSSIPYNSFAFITGLLKSYFGFNHKRVYKLHYSLSFIR